MKFYFLIFITINLILSCGNDQSDSTSEVVLIQKKQSQENLNIYFSTMKNLEVIVYFEGGADPYVGKKLDGSYFWDLLESNIASILELREQKVSIVIPKTLDQMDSIEPRDQESWNTLEIKNLINELNVPKMSSESGKIIIVFLKGHYKDHEQKVQTGVIGVSISDTNIIAIFKDVIRASGLKNDDRIAKFTEQSTLIHEVGHTLGLVNNGVPIQSEHHDEEHGAHCTNKDCVMYWQNEGLSDLVNFAKNRATSGTSLMFGEECLEDLKQLSIK